MLKNQTAWDYYPKDGSFYVDPMYQPYMRTLVDTKDGVCAINTWARQGLPDGEVNPALVRKGWSLDFQRLYPEFPCPAGYTPGEYGWCAVNESEFGNHGLYTKDAFVPKYQYFNGYAPKLASPKYKEINEFDMRSVNPWTGDYTVYFNPNPNKRRSNYGSLPSKDSLLA